MNLDRDIFKAIKGHTETSPHDLVGILAYIDSQQKLLMTHEELSGGLQRLIDSGQIAEATPHTFYDTAGQSRSREFSGLPLEEYQEACDAYQAWFSSTLRDLENTEPSKDDFTRQKIVIRWKLKEDEYATEEDEEAAEELASQIDTILAASRQAEISGFMNGPGYIDISIFGKETDEDTDAIYAAIVETFKAFGCPPGSCIIRQYEDRDEEITSDIVGTG